MDLLGGTTERSTLRRHPERALYGRESIYAVFDEAPFCHVGFVVNGSPVVLPTVHARVGDSLVFHGSRSNRMFRSLVGNEACVTATLFDGLVLAKSAMHHSMNYRSVVAFGRPRPIEEAGAKGEALEAVVEHVLPGRSVEVRPPSPRELAVTTVLVMEIEEASAKARTGPPVDDDEDLALPFWSGVVPARPGWGEPVPEGERSGLLPDSLLGLLAGRPVPVGQAFGVEPVIDIPA